MPFLSALARNGNLITNNKTIKAKSWPYIERGELYPRIQKLFFVDFYNWIEKLLFILFIFDILNNFKLIHISYFTFIFDDS